LEPSSSTGIELSVGALLLPTYFHLAKNLL